MSGPWLLFRQGSSRYALPLASVAEVAPSERLHAVPLISRGIGGVVNLRGEPLPVIRAATLLDEAESFRSGEWSDDSEFRHLIVLRKERIRLGIAVEQILRIERSLSGRARDEDLRGELLQFVSWIQYQGNEIGLVDPDALLEHAQARLTERRCIEGRQESCPSAF